MQQPLCPLPTRATRPVLTPLPAWLPPAVANDVRAHLASSPTRGKGIAFTFSKGEKKVMRRRKNIPVSQWAERHRVLEMSSIPGKWKNLFTPYLVGIMDAAGSPSVETVIICKSPQTGGSEAGHNLVGWCIDRSSGPVLYVYPDEITARENAKDRIIPMINASPRLREYLTGMSDDASSLRINLAHMPIYLGWSGSVSRLGNKPIRTLILDELDKYKNPKNEATSEALAELRTTTWRNRKHIFKISTPTTENAPIWQALTVEAGARCDYWVACPHCGIHQHMQFARITWPGKMGCRDSVPAEGHGGEQPPCAEREQPPHTETEPSPEAMLTKRLATYPCDYCGAVWDDGDRDRAVRHGEWRERSSGLELMAHIASHKPQKVGFHIPAWLSYFVSLSAVAAAALKYQQSGKLDDLKTLQNQYKAEPWKQEAVSRSEDAILALCDDRPRGTVPGPVPLRISAEVHSADAAQGLSRATARPAGPDVERVCCLLAGVDTHAAHFRYTIRAFGFGDTEETWLVACGIAPSFSALNELLWGSSYKDATGREHTIRACMIDAMGHRTKEVYAWAIRNRGRVFPWQGVRSLSQPYTPAPQEYFPDAKGNKIRIPGGLNLWRCDTTFFKNDLSHKLGIHPADPGAFHLHCNEGGVLEQYAREMCAEVWDDKKLAWENPSDKDNHYWDCEVMTLALAYIMNVRHIQPAGQPKKPVSQQTLPPVQRGIPSRFAQRRR